MSDSDKSACKKLTSNFASDNAENILTFLTTQLQRSGFNEEERKKYDPKFLLFMHLILVQTGSNLIKMKKKANQVVEEDELRVIQRLVQMNRKKPPSIEPKLGYAMELYRSTFPQYLKNLMRKSNFESVECDESHGSYIYCYARVFEVLSQFFFRFLSKKDMDSKQSSVTKTISYVSKNPEDSSISQITDELSNKVSSSSDEEKKRIQKDTSQNSKEATNGTAHEASLDSDGKENSSDGSPSSDSDEKGDNCQTKCFNFKPTQESTVLSRRNEQTSYQVLCASDKQKDRSKYLTSNKASLKPSNGRSSSTSETTSPEASDEKDSSSEGAPTSDSDERKLSPKKNTTQEKGSNQAKNLAFNKVGSESSSSDSEETSDPSPKESDEKESQSIDSSSCDDNRTKNQQEFNSCSTITEQITSEYISSNCDVVTQEESSISKDFTGRLDNKLSSESAKSNSVEILKDKSFLEASDEKESSSDGSPSSDSEERLNSYLDDIEQCRAIIKERAELSMTQIPMNLADTKVSNSSEEEKTLQLRSSTVGKEGIEFSSSYDLLNQSLKHNERQYSPSHKQDDIREKELKTHDIRKDLKQTPAYLVESGVQVETSGKDAIENRKNDTARGLRKRVNFAFHDASELPRKKKPDI